MAHITVTAAQQWLESTKLTITSLDAELEASASNYVLSRLAVVYPTESATWTNSTNTPTLVKQVISMYYAAWFYNRQYSEDSDGGNPWADKLQALADNLLMGIIGGIFDLSEVPGTLSDTQGISFFPDDTTGATQQYDDLGYPVGGVGDAGAKFSMGKVF